jgi:hypothetical protein
MAIEFKHLKQMNKYVAKGMTIEDIRKKYSQYGYYEILSQVDDHSLLGKQRMVTLRLKRLESDLPKKDRKKVVKEIKNLLKRIYVNYKIIGEKLIKVRSISN